MRNGFQKWAIFPGPWQHMNQFDTQGGIQDSSQGRNGVPSSIMLLGGPFGTQCG
jgi:hypothetical protein